jgi:hypothetical protein
LTGFEGSIKAAIDNGEQMKHKHAIELIVYLGVAIALLAFAVLVITAIDLIYSSYGLVHFYWASSVRRPTSPAPTPGSPGIR